MQLRHWPPGYADEPVLCGHVHGLWGRRGNAVNVGVDVRGFCPRRLEKLVGF